VCAVRGGAKSVGFFIFEMLANREEKKFKLFFEKTKKWSSAPLNLQPDNFIINFLFKFLSYENFIF